MTCIMIGGALVHFADEDQGRPRHHSGAQARCEVCGRFLQWDDGYGYSGGWWACSRGCDVPR